MKGVSIIETIRKGVSHLRAVGEYCSDSDLMIRGSGFYAFWDEANHIWSRDYLRFIEAVDEELKRARGDRIDILVDTLSNDHNKSFRELNSFIKTHPDNYHELDNKITFEKEESVKTDYVSKRLTYSLDNEFPYAYDKLVSELYSPEERDKFEWGIGSILAGDSVRLQKFFAFYGKPGSGKSTILDIIELLFEPYSISFNAEAVGKSNDSFSLEPFASGPLVAIQQDADLSGIETNVRLNSIVSHDRMTMNEKYKTAYEFQPKALIFIGTNKPVRISDSKSGLKRRLIDIHPSGGHIPYDEYRALKSQISFELGKIANLCLTKYKAMGFNYYDKYIPLSMVEETDYFYSFMLDKQIEFENGISLKRAYDMYCTYCDESGYSWKLNKTKFKMEFMTYFESFDMNVRREGSVHHCWFSGLKMPESSSEAASPKAPNSSLAEQHSLIDDVFADCPAQLAVDEKPSFKWDSVSTTLKDIDTGLCHYVRPPKNHIVIDFDLKEDGQKSLEKNLEAAKNFPPTYMEVSKGGQGLHLHYIYDGDTDELSYIYSEGIEVKRFPGLSSLRRRLTKCNNLPIAHISSGLPKKGVKKVVDFDTAMNEQSLRAMILRNIHKEYHAYTTPSIQFIKKLLDDMYNRGEPYDVTDMRTMVQTFAAKSSNQASYCLRLVNQMKFQSEVLNVDTPFDEKAPIAFFDCEVFPNLFIVCWKYQGTDQPVVRMINPTSSEIEELISGSVRLIGFNNRRYDNHILYGCYVGESNERLYQRSQGIISDGKTGNWFFREAYNLSYTDIYDFASAPNKKSLKKWEIELRIKHQECPYPWDQPVDPCNWTEVADYCANDVIATEAVFNRLRGDWTARQILAKISGLTPNDTTNQHTSKIIWGDEKNPRSHLVYTDLSDTFPGYKFESGKSFYKGENINEGGFVFAKPGMYKNVKVFDVVSMHPTSIEELNLFGKYTKRFSDLKLARVYIKHKDMDGLSRLLDGALLPFLNDKELSLKDLSNALKTAINCVYGLTNAHFDNIFRDPRNVDNIVAKRGALFMVDLKQAIQGMGYTVVHIKTDSIKIANADEKIEKFIIDFGQKYGYDFEVENVYDRICLVNNAVYIAMHSDGKWDATGAQFAEPYVFKTLFSKEELDIYDYWQTKSVKNAAMYLGNRFVGGTGAFLPIINGEELICKRNGKDVSVSGTKGYLWAEAADVEDVSMIDKSYYQKFVDDAISDISQYGDFYIFADASKDAELALLPF